ncbi:hypothetical protein [Chromobacterium sp. IIBBL 290-4]|uniref:hypothetical protein n=1 Tax=Chromobacterium sp. IIBBL 290-4 TaxID=2953890 RepID=UPI0020B8A84D|nr:hypothetical protein [Chromobacterium sp. IIBBL 290-4]UTH76201.1 hypothetical protein NKT35_08905 [Chromobacterium sp. IIBBL 290-4]
MIFLKVAHLEVAHLEVAHLEVDHQEVILEILLRLAGQVIQDDMTQAIQIIQKIRMGLIDIRGKI